MITNSFYSTELVLNRNLSEVQLQCSAIGSNATSLSKFKSTVILVSLMVVSSHQSEKLSQLQTMLETGRAGPLPVTDRLELRRLADALCYASRVTNNPENISDRVDATIAALKRLKANLKRRTDARDGLTSKRLMDLPEDERFVAAFTHYILVSRQRLLRERALPTDHLQDISGPLWISTRGSTMTSHAFYYAITRISDELLGAPLYPHLLGDCAASALSSDAPEYILAASRILGHRDLATTLDHYEQSSMLAAGANLASTMEALQQQAMVTAVPLNDDIALPFLDLDEVLA